LEDSKVEIVEGVQVTARNFISFNSKLLEEAILSEEVKKPQ
jgi:hypothetical protein